MPVMANRSVALGAHSISIDISATYPIRRASPHTARGV
jgi:hypothetical protein